jgi:hypothetical protein
VAGVCCGLLRQDRTNLKLNGDFADEKKKNSESAKHGILQQSNRKYLIYK